MVFMLIVCVVVFGLLVLVAAVRPVRSELSNFELKRRQAAGDEAAKETLRRERLLGDIESLQRVVVALLLVIFVSVSVATFGWLLGIVIALVVALEYGAVARWPQASGQAAKLYGKYEPRLLGLVARFPGAMKFIRNAGIETSEPQLDSREELVHLVEGSRGILSIDEKKLLTHGLGFGSRGVREVMTPRGVIDSIEKTELLGPLALDDLHKTGHSRFPVTDGDLDHVVGILHIHDLFTLDTKKGSVTAEKAMEPRVFYIREDQTLQHALAAFLRTHHHLFVVVNEFRETVGLLSLEDVIEALLGRKIMDEFDAHDDLRAVAKRNPRGNNHPEKHENV